MVPPRSAEMSLGDAERSVCATPPSGRSFVDRVGARFQTPRLAVQQIQHDRFVGARLQPRGWYKERLLRTHAPVAAQIVTVDPDQAFAPTTHIQEGVAHPREAERPTIQRWARSRVAREGPFPRVGERPRIVLPIFKLFAV